MMRRIDTVRAWAFGIASVSRFVVLDAVCVIAWRYNYVHVTAYGASTKRVLCLVFFGLGALVVACFAAGEVWWLVTGKVPTRSLFRHPWMPNMPVPDRGPTPYRQCEFCRDDREGLSRDQPCPECGREPTAIERESAFSFDASAAAANHR